MEIKEKRQCSLCDTERKKRLAKRMEPLPAAKNIQQVKVALVGKLTLSRLFFLLQYFKNSPVQTMTQIEALQMCLKYVNMWRETYAGKHMVVKIWRETYGGKHLQVNICMVVNIWR